LAYKSFETHAALTGNATSQSYLAFFHATGYQGVVPVDQAKAQLYYTFAAHGEDRAAQMALGFRDWTGIGVVESCDRAVEWYSAAADQGKHCIPLSHPLLTLEQQWTNFYLARLADVRFH
jgi:TPR repeat protein